MTQSYPEFLKAISIHAPHAYAICMGIKQAEYRSQPTQRRGWILIHASQSKDSDHYFATYGISKDTIKRGAIIGAAQITDCTWDAENECYAYHLSQPILFNQPLEGIKGCQAIFWRAKQPDKQAAFAATWEMIEAAISPKADDISIEANDITQDLAIPGYHLETEDNKTYQVFDSLTEEPLFKIYSSADGWTNDLTKQTHSTPQLAIAQAREKTILRIDRSRPLEVEQISNTFIVRNPDNGNHYAVRPNHPDARERCECGDAHFRGVRCKHQIAADDYQQSIAIVGQAQSELNQYIQQQAEEIAPSWRQQAEKTYARLLAGEELIIDTSAGEAKIKYESEAKFGAKHLSVSRCGKRDYKPLMAPLELEKYVSDLYNPKIIEAFGDANPRFLSSSKPDVEFTSPDGFYDWDATVVGKTIATIHYDDEHSTQRYVVAVGGKEVFRWNTQARAERYILWHYKQGTLPIVEEEEKTELCTIEDCKYTDDKGQQYAFRIDNQLIGYIWLSDNGSWDNFEEFWTNGDGTKYADWRECGLKLAQIKQKSQQPAWVQKCATLFCLALLVGQAAYSTYAPQCSRGGSRREECLIS